MLLGELIHRDGGNIKTGPFGTVLKANEYSREGVPLISVGEIGYGYLHIHESTPRAPPEVVERLPEYVLESGDIVFGRKGAVDRLALIKTEQSGWFLGSDGIRLRLPLTCDARFISYLLRSQTTRSWLLQHATGTTMASLNQKIIERIPLVLPPLRIQKFIASILGALDDKIEFNYQMNKTLETIGKTIFKYWFIDFEFPNEEGKPYRSSGGEMIHDKELGKKIPKGWNVNNYGDLLIFERGIEPGSKNYLDEPFENSIKFYRVGDMSNNSICSTYVDNSLTNNIKSERDDILVSFDGTIGRVQTGIVGAYSTGIRKIYSKNNYFSKTFIYFLMKSKLIQETLDKFAIGTTILHASESLKYMINAIPNIEVLDTFSLLMTPHFEKILLCKEEIHTLSQIRDSLLPKLMSGKIKIPTGIK
jgi:type I restriction enzyme S subunit